MRFILQHDQRDCGAACLAMIASYHKAYYPIARIRELTKTDKTGTTVYGIVNGAEQLGLKASALTGTADELVNEIREGKIAFPFIAHVVSENAMLHFVVVSGISHGSVTVYDPAKGKRRIPLERFFASTTGYYIVFEKTDAFRRGNFEKGSFLKFFALLKGQYTKLIGIVVISLLISAIGILGAFVFESMIDHFAVGSGYYATEAEHSHGDTEHAEEQNPWVFLIEKLSNHSEKVRYHYIFVLIIGMYLLQAGIQFMRGCLIVSVSKKIDLRLTLSYYNHIVGLPVSLLAIRQTGEYLSRFSDADNIREAISGATLTILLDSAMVIFCGIILYQENEKLFGISLLMIVLYAILVLGYRKPLESINRDTMESNAVVQSYLKESIDGAQTVKAANAEETVIEKTTCLFHRFINLSVKNSLLSMSQDVLADTVELVGTVIILWKGFSLADSGLITIGSLITFYVLLGYFTQPIKNLIELQPAIQTAIIAADRLNDILDLPKESGSTSENTVDKIESIEFQNVDFRYGNRELTLENVNLTIHRGEKIAIVGESGSGKTTLAKLLLRFYQPESGGIRIDGKDIKDADLNSLRQNIAYVDQNTFLFSDTIRNNLCLGNTELTDEEIEQACKVSQANQFVQNLPMGYDTPLDENGANLSGGQRQRLAIARALLKKPKLLILDEATSNLDTITEAAIKNTVFQLDQNLTCIIIAHRLSTIKNCDRIYVMEQGKIVETGTHTELMESNGLYAQLWNMQ